MAPQSCTKSSINHIMDVSGCSIPLRTLALFADLMKRQQERTDPFPFANWPLLLPKKKDGHVGWQRLVHVPKWNCIMFTPSASTLVSSSLWVKNAKTLQNTSKRTQRKTHPLPAVSLTVRSTLGRPHKFWLLRSALGQPFFPCLHAPVGSGKKCSKVVPSRDPAS